MKKFDIAKGLVALVCLVAVIGLTGCDDDVFDVHPNSIGGAWSCTFTRAGDVTLYESWFFNQSGSTVSGYYTFKGDRYTFSGSYDDDDGEFRAVDSDNWTLSLDFDEEDEGKGTISGVSGTGGFQTWNAKLSR